jgi:hypothetical protein
VGPRAGLDAVVKRKIPSSRRDWNPPIIQPVAERYTTELSRLLFHLVGVKLGLSYRMSLFENRVLRRKFGPKREEVAGEWRKLHNKELHTLPLHQVLLQDEIAGHVVRMEEINA